MTKSSTPYGFWVVLALMAVLAYLRHTYYIQFDSGTGLAIAYVRGHDPMTLMDKTLTLGVFYFFSGILNALGLWWLYKNGGLKFHLILLAFLLLASMLVLLGGLVLKMDILFTIGAYLKNFLLSPLFLAIHYIFARYKFKNA